MKIDHFHTKQGFKVFNFDYGVLEFLPNDLPGSLDIPPHQDPPRPKKTPRTCMMDSEIWMENGDEHGIFMKALGMSDSSLNNHWTFT